jgi:hypothetical protein
MLWGLTSLVSGIYPLIRKWQYFGKGKCSHQVSSPCIQCSKYGVSPRPVHRNGCSDNPPPPERGYQTTLKAPISVACHLQWALLCEFPRPPRLYYPVEPFFFLAGPSTVRSVRTLYVPISFSWMIDPLTHLRSLQYRASDAPRYRLGHGLVLLYIGIGNVSSIAYHIFLRRENAARNRGERDEVIEGDFRENEGAEEREDRARRNGRFASVDEAKREKGDQWSGYRYIL